MVNFSFKQALFVILFSVAVKAADDKNFRLLGSSSSDSDDDGEKVCTSIDGSSCCKDSVYEVTNDGTLYCSKFDIAVSSDGKGIEKTYADGDTDTVWWLNIEPCQLNSMDLCHFDHDDDTTVSVQSDATGDDAEGATTDVDSGSVTIVGLGCTVGSVAIVVIGTIAAVLSI